MSGNTSSEARLRLEFIQEAMRGLEPLAEDVELEAFDRPDSLGPVDYARWILNKEWAYWAERVGESNG